MKLSELFKTSGPKISFEFFPPKTAESESALLKTIETLKSNNPSFVSMTYGAGGATRGKTVNLVATIKHELGIEAAAHLTCVGHSKEELGEILSELQAKGVENIVALRGDPPKGEAEFRPAPNGFQYASELVAFIKKDFNFSLAVAGYPEKHIEAESLEKDLAHLKAKVDNGADVIITQLFFENADFFSFVEKVRSMGISIPIVAGIMPVKDYRQIVRFTQMCGASIPSLLKDKLEKVKDNPEDVEKIGIDHATAQCEELLKKGAAGIHFYTLNKSTATQAIYQNLKRKNLV